MKEKLARGIVKGRYVILAVMIAAVAFSAACMNKTHINYDLTQYLSEETMTRRALIKMEEEFGSSEQLRVMFADQEEEALQGYVAEMNALPEVLLAAFDGETGVRQQDGKTWQLVTLTLNPCDTAALIDTLRGMFPQAGEYFVGGAAASQLDIQERVAAEIPLALLIALAVVIAVLVITSRAWMEPVLILVTLGVSILINMGTNFLFPSVSFITHSVCAILQLALSIDYAIMLLHRYNDFSEEGLPPKEAMTQALAHAMMPISSSACTTAAGLLSLLFMSFTIGFDIGIVLTKGIFISMLTVFLLTPALTLIFHRAMVKTRHKPLRLGSEHLAAFVAKAKKPLAAILALLIFAGAYLQTGNDYVFTDAGHVAEGSENARIEGIFGTSDPLVLLIPGGTEDEDYDKQRALAVALQAVSVDGQTAVKELRAMVTDGAAALEYYTAPQVAEMTGLSPLVVSLAMNAQGFGVQARADRLLEMAGAFAGDNPEIAALRQAVATARQAFEGKNYSRMLLTLSFGVSDEAYRTAIEEIMAAARASYGEDFYLTGSGMSVYDIGNAFQSDLMLVNLITLGAILLIVMCSFRRVGMPVLLVFVIEGSIWLSMGISRLLNEQIFFLSYLICVSIQMGATIDYGILFMDQYRALRERLPMGEALREALNHALPTILTSGSILVTAGFIIGKICSIFYISSIGLLLARGALISVILILTLLPALLMIFDRWVLPRKKRKEKEIPA